MTPPHRLLSSSCSRLSLLLFLLPVIAAQTYTMDPDEARAAYEILHSINSDIPWRSLYPDTNLCLSGPHGLNCEADGDNVLHVVELSFGWVGENDNNPPCGPHANISPELRRLRYLRKLMFYRCFTEVEVDIGTSVIWASIGASLENLALIENTRMVGGIPTGDRMTRLERLVIVGNERLGGKIPADASKMFPNLRELVLNRNGLVGAIPGSVCSISGLSILDLGGNALVGDIPRDIGDLSRLRKLDLSRNRLSGSIPETIGTVARLELLDLSRNELSGGMPLALASLSTLRVLELGGNPLGGEVPNMWSGMSQLRRLGLAGAGLTGQLPPSLGHLLALTSLDLSNNSLEGRVAYTLGLLPSIYRMDLSRNRLQGALPFPGDVILRLGRNLRLEGNAALCLDGWDWAQLLSAQIDGVRPCPRNALGAAHEVLEQRDAFTRWPPSSAWRPGLVSLRLLVGLVSIIITRFTL